MTPVYAAIWKHAHRAVPCTSIHAYRHMHALRVVCNHIEDTIKDQVTEGCQTGETLLEYVVEEVSDQKEKLYGPH